MGVSIHHIDVAVSDVERSLAFYLGLLAPFGMKEAGRFPTYRGTEEVVYLAFGDQYLGLRQADGGEYRYYDVGMEHLAPPGHDDLEVRLRSRRPAHRGGVRPARARSTSALTPRSRTSTPPVS